MVTKMFDFIVLGTALNKPMTGYDIKKEIEHGVGNYYKASYGNLYPTLEKLTAKGYLTMTEQTEGKRVKKYYVATTIGRTSFLEWLALPVDFKIKSLRLLVAKIWFYGELPEDVRAKRIDELEIFGNQRLQALLELEKEYAEEEYSDVDYFEMATLYLGIQNVLTSIAWYRHIKERRPLAEFLQPLGGNTNEEDT